MAQVPAVRTPTTIQQLAATLASIWPSVVGGSPQQAIPILVAQSDMETGAWANMWNWNVGNLAGTGGDYVMLTAYTGALRPYRAFTSLADGATAYLSLMKGRYSAALSSAQAGDLDGFATNLKARGYYEEDESAYLAALESRYPAVQKALGSGGGGYVAVKPAPQSSALTMIVGGLALGAAGYLVYERYMVRGGGLRVRRRRAA